MSQAEDNEFEAAVRRIARELWSAPSSTGPAYVGTRERDYIFETEDSAFIVEATTSKKKGKIADDAKKTADAVREFRQKGKMSKGYLVTREDPTVDQIGEAKKYSNSLELLSFDSFRSKLLDGLLYCRLRSKYYFGSARNLDSVSAELPRDQFVDPTIRGYRESWTVAVQDFIDGVLAGGARFLVTADFGSGKSMLLRELFYSLSERYISNKIVRCPIHINLRDHWGQDDPSEVLTRHAKRVGFGNDLQIVRAWRAGFCDIILDGFDEIANQTWSGNFKKLRQVRSETTAVIRNFVQQTPESASVVICGRANYFDSISELENSLGIEEKFRHYTLDFFDNDQIHKYFQKLKKDGSAKPNLPAWLPARPLLVGYLISMGVLAAEPEFALTRGQAWAKMIERIAKREAQQQSTLEPLAVQKVIERLATLARRSLDGLGRLSFAEIEAVFTSVSGAAPDHAAQVFLARLPGLGPSDVEDGTRTFVDADLAEAAGALDVESFMAEPYAEPNSRFSDCQTALGDLGIEVLATSKDSVIHPGSLRAALKRADDLTYPALVADICNLSMFLDADVEKIHVCVSGVNIKSVSLRAYKSNFAHMSFRDCVIKRILVDDVNIADNQPTFRDCIFGSIEGVVSEKDLPNLFKDCLFEEFTDSIGRNADIFDTDLNAGVKVLMTVLNKLFFQAGSGRQEAAFSRGLSPKYKTLVEGVLEIVASEGFAKPSRIRNRTIWMPFRDFSARARAIIAAPQSTAEPIVGKCAQLVK